MRTRDTIGQRPERGSPMQSHLYGTWHATLHDQGIRHDYERANGPAALRATQAEPGQPRRPLVTRLRASLGAMVVAVAGRSRRSRPSGAETGVSWATRR
jgi:hypothetical protein